MSERKLPAEIESALNDYTEWVSKVSAQIVQGRLPVADSWIVAESKAEDELHRVIRAALTQSQLVPVPLDFLQSVQWLLEMPITQDGFDTTAEYEFFENMRAWLDDLRRWIDDAEAVVNSA